MIGVMHSANAVILARYDAGERDVLVVMYSAAYGKKYLLARGAKDSKSKQSSSLLPGAVGTLWWTEGKNGRSILTNAATVPAFIPGISFSGLYGLQCFLDFIVRVTKENEHDDGLYNVIINTLDNVRKTGSIHIPDAFARALRVHNDVI